MLKNYFKIAFRNLWRHRGFSFLNIIGLTVGMTAFFLIFLYVKFELSYESFNSKADRIYRVVADLKTPTETINTNGPAWAVAPNITTEFPEIEAAVRFDQGDELVRVGDQKFKESNIAFVDSLFFNVFDYKLLKGNRRTALKEPFSILLSEVTAKKYFGNADALGKNILITNDGLNATVTGVMEDMPENSQLKADLLISMNTVTEKLNKGINEQWANYGPSTFLLLKSGTNPVALQDRLPAFLERRNGDQMKQIKMFPTLILEPLRDVYLRSTRDGSKIGNINNVYIFSIIGIFILLIAGINFVNLTTARSSERAKEVGIRKVVGAEKNQLAFQFIGESVLLCLLAFILTLGLAALLLPLFNELSGKIISHGIFSQPLHVGILLIAAVLIGMLAGVYPALVLSSFKPITVLKGRFATAHAGIFLRKSLVVTQFAISIALIIGTIVVYTQMKYMRNSNLGFSKDQKLIVDSQNDPGKDAFIHAILSLPSVKSTSLGASVPGGQNPGAYTEIENAKGDMQIANLDVYFVGFSYIPQYNIQMLAGRSFSPDFKTDTTQAMVINEAAMRLFGYTSPAQAIGKKYDQWGSKGTIIGVMKDFHFHALQELIKPLSMRINFDRASLVTIGIAADNIPATLAAIETKWKTTIPNKPYSYFFLDEFFDEQYRSEDKFGKLFFYFSLLAIFISCLGLLGLASYSTVQRKKEIGVRKILGASVSSITNLLSIEFLKIVFVSFVVAAPLAWYFMHSWLKDFAYRINMSWWMFALGGCSAVFIALATVSYHAVKAAIMNPIKSLRTE